MEMFQKLPAIEVFNARAVFTRQQPGPQLVKSGFILLQLPKSGADCFTDRLKATLFYLAGDERFKMITERNGSVSGHVFVPKLRCIRY